MLMCCVVCSLQNTLAGNGAAAAPSAEAIASVRDSYFTTVYDMVNDAQTANSAPASTLRGALFWQWTMTNTPFVYDGTDLTVSYTDSTFTDVIAPSSATILGEAASNIAGCTKRNQPATPATATAGRRLLAKN